VYTLYEKGEG